MKSELGYFGVEGDLPAQGQGFKLCTSIISMLLENRNIQKCLQNACIFAIITNFSSFEIPNNHTDKI